MLRRLKENIVNRLALLRTRFGRVEHYLQPLNHFLIRNKKNKNILVLCTGNICRSPYACARLNQLLEQRGVRNIFVRSAGTFTTPGQPADGAAVEAASERGVDLSMHATSLSTPPLLRAADLILIMDHLQLGPLKQISQNSLSKTMFLGSLLLETGGPLLIEDPYGRTLSDFHECYGKIDRALFELVRRLTEERV